MARMPGWIKVTECREKGSVLVISVRKWHPGWWLFVARALWRALMRAPHEA